MPVHCLRIGLATLRMGLGMLAKEGMRFSSSWSDDPARDSWIDDRARKSFGVILS